MNKRKQTIIGTLLILLAGVLWGTMGFFVRNLSVFGFSAIQIASLQLVAAAVFFSVITAIRKPSDMKIRLKDIPLFLGLGLMSVLFFKSCYFGAINCMNMSVAAILLYTSPIWVMLLSAIIFRHRITAKKLVALALAFAGCVLVSGVGGGGAISAKGLVLGLCSGFGYGLYSIFGTVALRRYSTFTVTMYTFIIAGLGSLFVADVPHMVELIHQADSVGYLIYFILLSTVVTSVVPYLAYTAGLKNTEPGRAAVLATIEPIVAAMLGAVMFREALNGRSVLGIVLVLSAVILLSFNNQKEEAL